MECSAAERPCFKRGKKSHRIANCTQKLYNNCNRRGHTADVCPTRKEEAVWVLTRKIGARNDDGDNGTVQASTFKAEETGGCSGGLGRMEDGELAWQVGDDTWVRDSGASTQMTLSTDRMTNYQECGLNLRIADGRTHSIKGCGDINFEYRSGNGPVQGLIANDAHVPGLRYRFFPLPILDKNGHVFERGPTRVVVRFKSERSIVFALNVTLFILYGYRVDGSTKENACATLAPGQPPNKSLINIHDLHCPAGRSHKVLLRKTAVQRGILEGELMECKGCSRTKGLRKGMKQFMRTRADKKLTRVLAGLSTPKGVQSIGGKWHAIIVRDDFARHTWMCFRCQKSDAAE